MAVKRTRSAARKRKAATSEVLGNSPAPQGVPARWARHAQHLLALRNELLRRQGDLMKDAAEEQPTFSQHMADAATDSFDRDLALSRIVSEQNALYEIDEALDRIRHGTYGVCELTGKPIEPGRLEAIPWTRFSRAAEETLERNGAVSRTRLAPLESVPRGPEPERKGHSSNEDQEPD